MVLAYSSHPPLTKALSATRRSKRTAAGSTHGRHELRRRQSPLGRAAADMGPWCTPLTLAHTHARARAHTRTHTRTLVAAHTHTRTHARTYTRIPTPTRTGHAFLFFVGSTMNVAMEIVPMDGTRTCALSHPPTHTRARLARTPRARTHTDTHMHAPSAHRYTTGTQTQTRARTRACARRAHTHHALSIPRSSRRHHDVCDGAVRRSVLRARQRHVPALLFRTRP